MNTTPYLYHASNGTSYVFRAASVYRYVGGRGWKTLVYIWASGQATPTRSNADHVMSLDKWNALSRVGLVEVNTDMMLAA